MSKVHPGVQSGPRAGTGPGKGNGCCCASLGGNPGPIPTDKITKAGGKFISVENNRVLEYYVYGSTKLDATFLLQFSGNFSTGYFFFAHKPLSAKLEELNIKGISISLPGVGYSSMNYGANMYDFCKNDVGKVLEAEKVDRFMVEGTSNGSMFALGVAHAHTDKLIHMYLNVPWFNKEVAAELTPHISITDFFLPCQAKCVSPNGLQSCCPGCCLFCCVSCISCSCFACLKECEQHPSAKEFAPGLGVIQLEDTKRAFAHHRAGMCLSQVYAGWDVGFDVRELAEKFSGKEKVLVSFAVNDASAPPDQGRALIKIFNASYMVADGNTLTPKMADGHEFWIGRLMSGATAELQLKLSPPIQQSMENCNEYFKVPVPDNFTLDFTTTKTK